MWTIVPTGPATKLAMTTPPEVPGDSPAPSLALVSERSAVRIGEREVVLTPTQFRLLAALMVEPGRAFSRAELLERGIGDLVTERTVDVHVKEIRRKLGADGWRVETVRSKGYRYRTQRPGG
jgi:DNA-binding response OmpR family regulator